MREEDLAELLGNLLDNASKWAATAVSVSVAVNDAVTISVEDDGPGAPEALMNWLGQRGLRLDQKVPGTGQGLAIAMDIAKAYGGSLTFEPVTPRLQGLRGLSQRGRGRPKPHSHSQRGRRMIMSGRFLRRALILWALAALSAGLLASLQGLDAPASWIWAAGTVPVIAALGVSITRATLSPAAWELT